MLSASFYALPSRIQEPDRTVARLITVIGPINTGRIRTIIFVRPFI